MLENPRHSAMGSPRSWVDRRSAITRHNFDLHRSLVRSFAPAPFIWNELVDLIPSRSQRAEHGSHCVFAVSDPMTPEPTHQPKASKRSFRGRVRPVFSGMGDALGASGARVALLPIGGLAALMASHLLIARTGSVGFAVFSLLAALPAMLPVSDFGVATSLTDSVVKSGPLSEDFRRTKRRVQIILTAISMSVIAIAAAGGVSGLWATVLGLEGVEANIAASIILAMAGVGVAFGSGPRLLLGLGHQTISRPWCRRHLPCCLSSA